MVNRIRSINVPVSSDAVVTPRAFLATVSGHTRFERGEATITDAVQVDGSIYLVALISPHCQNLLMRLQTNIARRVESLGHIPFDKYRAYKAGTEEDDEPYRFVDGELIEQFLVCTETTQEDLVEGLHVTVDEVRNMVEELRRLH
jgi:DNA damage-binding protein 1